MSLSHSSRKIDAWYGKRDSLLFLLKNYVALDTYKFKNGLPDLTPFVTKRRIEE
jgi:hypothetical protein